MASSSLKLLSTTTQQIWSHPTWDLVLLFALLAIGLFYGLTAGKKKIISAITYTYVAFAIFSALPLNTIASFAQIKNIFVLKTVLFAVVFIVLMLAFGQSGKGRGFTRPGAWWQIFLLTLVQTGLTVHILLGFLPSEQIKLLAPLTKTVFANPDFHIWWFMGPILMLMILKRVSSFEE
ncbi:MAG: hypothetical protein HY006_03220 [Candidatus Sungbacteria bacterium]|nr:hypothetical protein [Candidatus Sungbacteria bacterium]